MIFHVLLGFFSLKQKFDVASIIPKFFNMIHTQFEKSIKVFSSDNPPELLFTDFFNEKGVLHHFSYVEKPQQNSVAKRKHQHLLNVACALYFQSQLPLSFWTHCVLIVVFLINRTPSPLLQHKTPYELLYDKKLTILSFEYLAAWNLLLLSQLTDISFNLWLECVSSLVTLQE